MVVELDVSRLDGATAGRLARRVLVALESAGAHGLSRALLLADPAEALLSADDATVVVLLVEPSRVSLDAVGDVLAELDWAGVIVADDALASLAMGSGFVRGARTPAGSRIVVERVAGEAGEIVGATVVLSAERGVGRLTHRRGLRRLVVGDVAQIGEMQAWLRREGRSVLASRAQLAVIGLARRRQVRGSRGSGAR